MDSSNPRGPFPSLFPCLLNLFFSLEFEGALKDRLNCKTENCFLMLFKELIVVGGKIKTDKDKI